MSDGAEEDPSQEATGAEVQERIEWIRKKYGRVPLVVEEMSKRPDLFLPYFEFSRVAVFEPKHLDRKTTELAIVAAGSALASEHCLAIHLDQARAAGASKDEIAEALLVGAYMSLTKSQSVALRMLQQMKE